MVEQIEYERIRLEIERLRVTVGMAGGPVLYDPRLSLVQYHLQQGNTGTTHGIVQGMRDNPAAALYGYALLRTHFLNNDMPASALSIAREEHRFLRDVLGR